ncbi:MAG TPA: 30S ribosomal protein S19 [Thermoplasmata archaeon]|nr:30S ribosomal protein S19 [Thermoplasmata archaeon]
MAKSKRGARKIEVRKKREYTLRGRTLPELQAMPLSELSKLLTARARRSIRRGFTTEVQRFLEKILEHPKDRPIRTHTRDALILPAHVGHRVAIHSGKEFKEIEVRPEMIGHYYGEFALTRRFEKHSGPGVGATRSSKFMPLK